MGKRNEGKPIASPPETLAIALSLARAGWYVFPVNLVPVVRPDGRKATDKRPGRGIRWLTEATTDAEQIATWWGGEFVGAWIGVNAQRSGIVVADLDKSKPWGSDAPPELVGKPKGDGRENLKAAGIKLPKTLAYRTYSGGTHHVYRAPDGRALTIAQDTPVPSVDIRAGNGLMVYYGPELDGPPDLAPAPEWALVEPRTTYARSDGDIGAWLKRADNGKPKGTVKTLLRETDWHGLTHEPMLAAVSELIKHGTEPGAATAFEQARAYYVENRRDRERDWDNAAAGSIGQHGLPPITIALTKDERQAIKLRNTPEAVEAATAARKTEYRIAKHHEAATRPAVGTRILEDSPLAAEFAPQLEDRWAYATGLGLMRYDGRRWAPSEDHALIEAVRKLLIEVELEEHDLAARRGDNKAVDKARTLLSRGRAVAVARLVVGILAEHAPRFDADPDLLNCPNGVLDLRTLELQPHEPGRYLTKMAGVEFDPDADMSLWERALEALPKSVRPWMQERLGQAVTGHMPDDDVLLIMQGGGNNAKTTFLDGVREAIGEYGVTVSRKLLDADPGAHPTELMDLMGAHLAVFEELSEGRNLNVTRLKDTVGTPKITAHRMRQDNVTFAATHALMGSTNYLPVVSETDWGTWRRLALVVFPYRFIDVLERPNDRLIDPSIKQGLAKPNTGVLRWLAEGARRWYANGMRSAGRAEWPKPVRRDTEAWRLEADPVLAYVTERIVRDEGYAITTADLARDFNDWLEARGHRPWSQQLLNARFGGHTTMDGVQRRAVKFGISLRPSRPVTAIKAVPSNTTAWRGIRFEADTAHLVSEAEHDASTMASFEERLRR